MNVIYDRKANILYLKFSDSKLVDSDMVNEDVVVSFDKDGEIVNIDFC
ncbi:DUF2283 domain-containing protein [Geoglobus acetivorans]|uniref:DUF2283 domain-containing protein n=1 Tax=Geoglobus acetivorans TaxID=565033 RepID=A0ABZ3H518_GEOAI|nr:DUF2283 domain-containing protein [Geoglobus acetivorans]